MGDIIKAVEFLGMPTTIITIIVVGYLILNFIGEILELMGKAVPEFVKIRKYFKRKKSEKSQQQKLLEDVQKTLSEINSHYDADNIAKRDTWMAWVNSRAKVYDEALNELILLKDKLDENNEITLDLYINANRNRILDFARIVADDNALASREEFNRIYKVNKEYHSILAKYNKENGEVDTAMRLIDEAYDHRMKNHCFIEDVRGY